MPSLVGAGVVEYGDTAGHLAVPDSQEGLHLGGLQGRVLLGIELIP